MNYFIDTEFIEDGHTIDLISIGIVAEDGRELYVQNKECNLYYASDWVKANVFPHLEWFSFDAAGDYVLHKPDPPTSTPWYTRKAIAEGIHFFADSKRWGKPTFWGYYADYDWVAFCQLFGRMIDLPQGWPMYCRDLRQSLDEMDLEHVKQPDDMPHHALSDARWIADTHRIHILGQKTIQEL